MATAPAAALVGFAGMNAPAGPTTSVVTAGLPAATPLLPLELASHSRPDEAPVKAVEASYYGEGFVGRPTASGEAFDPSQLTAAHRTLPFGSLVRVTNAASGKDVVVRINDRGPFHGNRDIDLSEAAAKEIGMIGSGTAKVTLNTVRTA